MEDKVCVVTGASESSMGAGICKELAAAGFKKIVLISRTKSRLEATAEACKKIAAVETFVLPKDLAAPGTSAEAVKEIIGKYGSKYHACFSFLETSFNQVLFFRA